MSGGSLAAPSAASPLASAPTPQSPAGSSSRPVCPSLIRVTIKATEEELTRLQVQDRMLTAGMGGVLPEQPVYRTIVPFLRKWTHMPDDYEAIYQLALNEMQQPDFVGRVDLLTAWGTNAARDSSQNVSQIR
jgi:hypothetical protein